MGLQEVRDEDSLQDSTVPPPHMLIKVKAALPLEKQSWVVYLSHAAAARCTLARPRGGLRLDCKERPERVLMEKDAMRQNMHEKDHQSPKEDIHIHMTKSEEDPYKQGYRA